MTPERLRQLRAVRSVTKEIFGDSALGHALDEALDEVGRLQAENDQLREQRAVEVSGLKGEIERLCWQRGFEVGELMAENSRLRSENELHPEGDSACWCELHQCFHPRLLKGER